jgi:2-dehydro-3-deoxyphosphooctonate aldolase (KDO 8-P synthase)
LRVINTETIWKQLTKPRQLFLIAGPCVIENEQLCRKVAASLTKTCRQLGIFYVFKASFDKANRTSGKSLPRPLDWNGGIKYARHHPRGIWCAGLDGCSQ